MMMEEGEGEARYYLMMRAGVFLSFNRLYLAVLTDYVVDTAAIKQHLKLLFTLTASVAACCLHTTIRTLTIFHCAQEYIEKEMQLFS